MPVIAFTPERATRHRSPLMRWLIAHQGWYFFPLLLLEGVSLHTYGIRRAASRQKVERRWVELTFSPAGYGCLIPIHPTDSLATLFALVGVDLSGGL